MKNIDQLRHRLDAVKSVDEFHEWVRSELKVKVPHAALLLTVGRLYGVGSVPTHRLSVDFPLELVEEIKNSAGALDDPSIYSWFRSQKLQYHNFENTKGVVEQSHWRTTLLRYGFCRMVVHGVLDHSARRFAILQIANPLEDGLLENISIVTELILDIARVTWRNIDVRRLEMVGRRGMTFHPTLSLTAAELHIVELMAQGFSNKEIARRRGVSDSTIKTQVQRTGAKVGATRRAEIVALALPFLSPLPPQTMIDYDD